MPTELQIMQFCLCEDEWCFCPRSTMMSIDDAAKGKEWVCDHCLAGHHVKNPAEAFKSNPRRT